MARKYAKLERIEFNDQITKENHYEFLFHLQNAVFLALRERGVLTPMQLRYAEEKLKQQRRKISRSKKEES